MSFEIHKWDGLAKRGKFTTKSGRSFETPALFPVVHPKAQRISPETLQNVLGFDQFIISTYIISKHYEIDTLPSIHEFLDSKSVIMMDSGAYQLMLYGDVELSSEGTIRIQEKLQTDIGVIMDHPIGYDVSFKEAKKRVETTVNRVNESLKLIGDESAVSWTLPIQGGKYLDLIGSYLDQVITAEILKKYSFFALGSVVQVMINQDYSTLVKMIITAKEKLPVKFPLHLFGAGHPAMFALAAYLGCDTFDSAAYSLMAKDGRYMTSYGTYHINDLPDLPCVCPVCSKVTLYDFINSKDKTTMLALHNLWVSKQEIMEIRLAISRGDLWDLVIRRANTVPGLARATKLAIKMLCQKRRIRDLYLSGTPASKNYAIRISNKIDLLKPEIQFIIDRAAGFIDNISNDVVIILFIDMTSTSSKRLPEKLLTNLRNEVVSGIFLASPVFGYIPISVNELFPTSQYTSDLTIDEMNLELLEKQKDIMKLQDVSNLIAISDYTWPDEIINKLLHKLDFKIIKTDKIYSELLKI
jgi:7-cyano-7-deazaguanine tRNA-ribosyltransferase